MASYSQEMLDNLDKGQLAAAKKSFIWALRKDDDDTLFDLAQQLYSLGFLKQAQRIYEKLLTKYPDEGELKTNLAEIAIDNGDNDQALNYLSSIDKDSPAYLESLLVAADLYQTEGEFEVTEQKLQDAYAVAPDEPAVLYALGEFYYLIKQFDKAIAYYVALIKAGYAEFDKVDIAGRLGMAYAQSGQFDQALAYLRQVSPEYQTTDIRFQTGLTQLHLGKVKEAITSFNDLIEADDQYASVYPALAQAYEKLHQYEKALKAAQEGLGVDQYNEQLFAQAAEIASHLDQPKLMQKYLSRAHQLDPENIRIALAYSNFLIQQGHHEENLKLLAPFVEEHDVDPQVEWNLAQSHQALEHYQAAGQAYDAALDAFSDDPDFLKQLIDFDQEAGRHDQLKHVLKHYVELVPTDMEMVDLLDSLAD